jgi:hypothetical protein
VSTLDPTVESINSTTAQCLLFYGDFRGKRLLSAMLVIPTMICPVVAARMPLQRATALSRRYPKGSSGIH